MSTTTNDTESVAEDVQKTVQTVQEREPWFELAADAEGKWHWCLWSGNGRQMARNAMKYNRQNDAMMAVLAFVKKVQGAKIICKAH